MLILGIETSCDETGVALYHGDQGLLAHQVYSQVGIHAEFGGVVPELASRDHVRKLAPMVSQLISSQGLTLKHLDGVAYTEGPGLVGALMVGATFAQSLAFGLTIPALGVHHMEAHLLAPMLEAQPPSFPFVALLVSGGHTMLVEVRALGAYRVLGESVDDAAGEAFDKTASLLGLPYPGGPALAKLAEGGHPTRFRFPRPMTDRPGLDFSFSGLKTAALTQIRRLPSLDETTRADVARGFEEAVTDTLLEKCRRAMHASDAQTLVLAGGVGANRRLRSKLSQWALEAGVQCCFPRLELCTDNGAMVAYAGYVRLRAGEHSPYGFSVRPRWSLESLPTPG